MKSPLLPLRSCLLPLTGLFILLSGTFCASPGYSQKQHSSGQHGIDIFHSIEVEAGIGSDDNDDSVMDWDIDAFIGTDENKLWFKTEGERSDSVTEQAEFWSMYSRNISTFWDLQIGYRHDSQTDSRGYLVFGFDGLAPYFLETEAHLFVGEDGDISARIRQEAELLFSQQLILQPFYEVNLFFEDVPEIEAGSGFSDIELGVNFRYQLKRQFALYLEIKYEKQFGRTANISRRDGADTSLWLGTLGFRLLF